MEDDPDLSAFDPDCLYRSLALLCASITDRTGDEQKILGRAMVFQEYVDPFGFDCEGKCDTDGKLKVSFQPVKKRG